MTRLRISCLLVLLLLVAGRDRAGAQNPDPTAPAKYGFAFRNFVDSMYSWDIYCHSFFGVPLDPNLTWATATFDRLFYELAFKTKILFSPPAADLGVSMPKLNKYEGYMSGRTQGVVSLRT